MTYVKLITDNKSRSALGSHSIIQEFDHSDTPTTPILRPVDSLFYFSPKRMLLVRSYEPDRQMEYVCRYNKSLKSRIKKNTYIYGECVEWEYKKELKIRILSNSTSDITQFIDKITFFICSADVEKPIFYSGNIDTELRTDIYINHEEFIKLENAIENQSIESSYITTYFKGLYSEYTRWHNTDELYYLPDIDVKDAQLINEGSDISYEYKLNAGNMLQLNKNEPLKDAEFNYKIEQTLIKPNNEK